MIFIKLCIELKILCVYYIIIIFFIRVFLITNSNTRSADLTKALAKMTLSILDCVRSLFVE